MNRWVHLVEDLTIKKCLSRNLEGLYVTGQLLLNGKSEIPLMYTLTSHCYRKLKKKNIAFQNRAERTQPSQQFVATACINHSSKWWKVKHTSTVPTWILAARRVVCNMSNAKHPALYTIQTTNSWIFLFSIYFKMLSVPACSKKEYISWARVQSSSAAGNRPKSHSFFIMDWNISEQRNEPCHACPKKQIKPLFIE